MSAAGQFGARIIRATWNNQGTITTAAPLLLASNGANTNAGTLDIAEGVLNLDLGGTGSITNTGNITIGTAAGLAVSNGILAHEAGAIGGTGFVNLANVTFSMIPDLTVGPLQALFTNTAISGSGTLFINPDNGVSLVDATVGTDIDAQGTLNFQGGVVLNGVVTLAPSSTFAVLGVPGGTTVTVAQPLVMNGPAILLSGADDVTLDVSAGGMTIPSGSSLSVPIATGGTRTIIGDLTLQGAISIDHPLILEGGAFAVSPSGGLNGTSALDLSAATSVTIDGGVFPGGVFPATLTIVGDFPLATGGTATFDIDGLIPGTEHDRIDVSGTASILGTINLQPSISPQPGDAFTVLTFGARGPGAVAGLTGPTDFVGSILDTVWTANSLRIEALPTLVFAGDSGGGLSSGVFRASPGGGRVIRVTPQGTTGDVYPRWAPDRSRIALNRPNQVDFTNELLLVSADGAVTATVMSDTSSRRARFNATGQRLAFECGDGFSPMQDVCAIQSDVSGSIAGLANAGNGAGKLFLTDGIAPDLQGSGAFAWDPSNTDELIVVRDSLLNGQRASQLWRIRFDGSGVTAVTDTVFATPGGDTLQIASMDWSPNGVFIAFEAANQAGNSAIYRFDVSTGAVTPLTFPTPSTFDRRPVVSPDNAEVLFARELDGWELRRVPATGGGEVTITPVFNHFIGQAGWDWSPDGSEIVLTDDIVSSGNVVVVRVLRSTTNGTYASDRIVVGRAGTLPGEVQDRQPSWRP